MTLVHALIYVAVMVATVTCPASLHLEKALIVLPAWEEVANCQRTRCLKRKKKEVPFVEGLLRQRPVMQMTLCLQSAKLFSVRLAFVIVMVTKSATSLFAAVIALAMVQRGVVI